ncbi:hypothetical protein ACWKWC_00875 [Geodermatophilus nigrescens]
MSDELWVVRAGQGAKHADEFLEGSYVAVSFVDFADEDLSRTDADTLKARARSVPEQSYARQLSTFGYRIQVGDLVVVPRVRGRLSEYLVARVTGAYAYSPSGSASGPHRREVTWLGRFQRSVLSEAAANTMQSLLTVFRPSAVEAELRDLLTALEPLDVSTPQAEPDGTPTRVPDRPADEDASLPVRVVPSPRQLPPTQLDLEIDSDGRARISSGYPALAMEQVPRHIDPGPDWRGVPGIYVLTGTDLQHSSSRTGNERTLTTTLIVKPWAYVGLSEDFLGRLSSHRQSKPEWRRALLVRGAAQPFSSDDIKYLEQRVHAVLEETGEVLFSQQTPRGNRAAQPRNTVMLDACAETVVAVLRLTGTLI